MSNEGKQVTINDVAKAAGVSKGTVDRVIHNRGEVSRKSREKVLKVINDLGYKPNFYASFLASPKERLIQCIMPDFLPGEFWSIAEKGINEAAALVSRYGIKVETVKYAQYSLESFRTVCAKVLENPPLGVLMAPIFGEESKKFASELAARNVPYVYFDSKIEDENYFAYFGMQMYQSGCLCADTLVDGRTLPKKVFMIRIARDKSGLSDPTAERRAGFMDYMKTNCPDVEIVNVMINPNDRNSIMETLDSTLGAEEGEKFIVMLNSRVHLVADYLEARQLTGCRVVGFDVLEKNVQALKNGTVSALIAQHTDHQTLDAVNAISDYLIFGKEMAKKDNYTQMDILTKDNCDYYLSPMLIASATR